VQYTSSDLFAEAIAHAHAAHDLERMVELLEVHGTELMSRGETLLVMNWVHALPRDTVFSRLRIFLFECWWYWYYGHTEVVLEMLNRYALQHGLPGPQEEDVTQLEQVICAHVEKQYPNPKWDVEQRANRIAEALALYGIVSTQRPHGAAFSLAACQRAVEYVVGLAFRSRILHHLGTVHILRNELTEAAAVLEEALSSTLADGSLTWLTNTGFRLMMLYEQLGQLHHATRIAQEIQQQAKGQAFLAQGTSVLFLGLSEYERNNLDFAEAFFQQLIALCKEDDPHQHADSFMFFLPAQLQLARISFNRGERAQARHYLQEVASHLARSWFGNEVFPIIKGEYALMLFALGDELAVRQWLEEYSPVEQGPQLLLSQFISLKHNHHLVYTKALLACQRWQKAEQVIQEQQILAEQQGKIGSLIQWLTLHAVLCQRQGQTEAALLLLAQGLHLAEPRGYMRVFMDEGAILQDLLRRLLEQSQSLTTSTLSLPPPAYLRRLLSLSEKEQRLQVLSSSLAEPALIEPLSGRELEVLSYLGAGCSNQEIAAKLGIAPSTVKSHLKAIYGKLGVESRTQALIQARKRGLV
jgi:ATP/maltotriose-dependent transcriptional regulator MalT